MKLRKSFAISLFCCLFFTFFYVSCDLICSLPNSLTHTHPLSPHLSLNLHCHFFSSIACLPFNFPSMPVCVCVCFFSLFFGGRKKIDSYFSSNCLRFYCVPLLLRFPVSIIMFMFDIIALIFCSRYVARVLRCVNQFNYPLRM